MKAEHTEEDESGQATWLLVGSVPILVGGVILLLQPNASVAQFGGAMLLLIGVALVAAAVWLRVGTR